MRLASFTVAAVLLLSPAMYAADTINARAVVAVARQRMEATDSRATGRLVRVDANGNRTSNAFSIKAHWFPGILRVLLEVIPSRTAAANGPPDMAEKAPVRILLEMRPDGQDTIRIFRPHETGPVSLPFSKWGESVSGTDFTYEDFLEPEYYWRDQTILKSARLGKHDCDVLKSTPGPSNHSHYAEVQTWLDHTMGYPIYVEKKLKEAPTVKEFTSLGLTQSGGIWEARQVEVKVHGRPGSTLLIFERGSTKAHLTLKDFSSEEIGKFNDHP